MHGAADYVMNGKRKSMPISRLAFAVILAAGTLPPAACADDTPAADAGAEVAATPSDDGAVYDGAVYSAPEEPADAEARPERVYYDLMRYDWYAHGQPLVFDSASYEPDGQPLAIDARSLERVGDYGGVDVYRRETDPRLYVPVYDGYWLAFEPVGG